MYVNEYGNSSVENKRSRNTNLISRELSFVSDWLVDNKLLLHLGKTESILFGQKCKLDKIYLRVCNGTKISPSSTVKYLGAELDQSLDGEEMARTVVNKVYARIKVANPNFWIQIYTQIVSIITRSMSL